jgi:hypothetical protein
VLLRVLAIHVLVLMILVRALLVAHILTVVVFTVHHLIRLVIASFGIGQFNCATNVTLVAVIVALCPILVLVVVVVRMGPVFLVVVMVVCSILVMVMSLLLVTKTRVGVRTMLKLAVVQVQITAKRQDGYSHKPPPVLFLVPTTVLALLNGGLKIFGAFLRHFLSLLSPVTNSKVDMGKPTVRGHIMARLDWMVSFDLLAVEMLAKGGRQLRRLLVPAGPFDAVLEALGRGEAGSKGKNEQIGELHCW